MLKPVVPKLRPDLSVRLKDIAEKQVPAKLKPIVVDENLLCFQQICGTDCPAQTSCS